ncbi:MAG: GNAT family N-acetyltransferase [Anaerolineales bacterium]|jgi:ribosomal-protein-alanine N-acetyltransferase
MQIPTITTSRLVLRPFSEDDDKRLHGILAEKDILRYFPNPGTPTLDQVRKLIANQLKHWEEHGFGWWAVEPIGEGMLIGWNGLQYLPDTDEIEVGYLLSKSHWNQGLATEGAQAGLEFAFGNLGLKQVVAIVHPENMASQRVIEKLGMNFTHQAEYFGMTVYRYEIDGKDASCLNGEIVSPKPLSPR